VGYIEEYTEEAPVMEIEPIAQAVAAPQTSYRGERDDDGSFIPPMPMMAEPKPATSATGYVPSQMASQHAPAPAAAPRADLFGDAPVAAPAVEASAPAKPATEKRTGGFFDRFTSNATRQAAPAEVQQPTLTVDNSDRIPASSLEDDLEIPAFL